MINLSLKDGFFPDKWKDALVKPILKKPNADLEFKNFRPVSNLSFLSKLTEKAVSHQMVHHMTTHDLMPVFQSAYREGHSAENALIKIRNDILMNMNNQEVTLLVLLDLSTAFDTIDHTLLLRRLQSRFGFTGTALAWLRSYLSNRFQYVVINDTCSNRFDLSFVVPQGSCLGPLLFSIYTSQLFDIVSHHLPQVHCYADDTQLYLAFKPDNNATQLAAVLCMETCVDDLRRWMIKDKLMLNDDKTKFVLIGTKQQLAKVCIDTLSVGIPHSVRPPSTNQTLARLTFVAKVSVDEFVGRRKAFIEEMRHFMGLVSSRNAIALVEQGKEPRLEFEPENTEERDHEDGETEDMDEEQENGDEPHTEEEASKERFIHEEEEQNDPELQELNKRLEEVTQSRDLEEMRRLHRELHARHVMCRQEAVRRVTNLI